jgi:hypothetical protein
VTLTRRDTIAAMALQALLVKTYGLLPHDEVVQEAATYADALLEELDKSPRAPPSHGKELAGDPAAPGSTDEGSSVSGSKDATPPASEPPRPGKLSQCEPCGGRGQSRHPVTFTWAVCATCSGSGKTRAA